MLSVISNQVPPKGQDGPSTVECTRPRSEKEQKAFEGSPFFLRPTCGTARSSIAGILPPPAPRLPASRSSPMSLDVDGYMYFVIPDDHIQHLQLGDDVMVWRKTWAERDMIPDCEARILQLNVPAPPSIEKNQNSSSASPSSPSTLPAASSTPTSSTVDSSAGGEDEAAVDTLRHRVRYYLNGSIYHVRPARLIRVHHPLHPDVSSPSPSLSPSASLAPAAGAPRLLQHMSVPCVLLCGETLPYRRQCWAQPRAGDVVIEIGASYGKATEIIAKRCPNVIGIDIAQDVVAEARRQHPTLRFECVDALAETQRLLSLGRGCTMLFLDIGGTRELETVARLVAFAKKEWRPRLIVVKSKEMMRSARCHLRSHGLLGQTDALLEVEEWWASLLHQAQHGSIVTTAKAKRQRRDARVAARAASAPAPPPPPPSPSTVPPKLASPLLSPVLPPDAPSVTSAATLPSPPP